MQISPRVPFGAGVLVRQYSGLLIRTVRVRLPAAPRFSSRARESVDRPPSYDGGYTIPESPN